MRDVIAVLEAWGGERRETEVERIRVSGAGEESVNCDYLATPAHIIPRGFTDVCLVLTLLMSVLIMTSRLHQASGWPMERMWAKLNSGRTWYRADNEAYIYWNSLDSSWWIDKVNLISEHQMDLRMISA